MSNSNIPLISVIMGVYNCGETLEECIESLLSQTCQNFEIIICDDGSTDNTYEIAKMYKDKFPNKIVLIENKINMGLNYTLNHCLKYAKGEYIARMDGDDLCDKTRFEKELNFLIKNPEYAIVSTPMKYFNENGVFKIGSGGGEPNINLIPLKTPFCHAACMVRKEAYDAVGGYSVDEKLLRVEDWHLWIKMYSKGYKGFVLDEPLYMMRDDQKAISRRKFKYRLNEAYVGRLAVKMLHLSNFYYLLTIRPIIVGLLPKSVYLFLHSINL